MRRLVNLRLPCQTSRNASLLSSAKRVELIFCSSQDGELWKPNIVADAGPNAAYVCKAKAVERDFKMEKNGLKKASSSAERELKFGVATIYVNFVAVGRQQDLRSRCQPDDVQIKLEHRAVSTPIPANGPARPMLL